MKEWTNGPITAGYTAFEARTMGGSFSGYIMTTEKWVVISPPDLSYDEYSTLPLPRFQHGKVYSKPATSHPEIPYVYRALVVFPVWTSVC